MPCLSDALWFRVCPKAARTRAPTQTGCPSAPIRFFHRGRIVELPGADPTRSVLDWLREDAALHRHQGRLRRRRLRRLHRGGGRAGRGDRVRCMLEPVNACIQFLPTLDGKALFTVEDLSPAAGRPLHPVQQAMVDCHGSQCGFCTPGFVMSLWACERERCASAAPADPAADLADDLAGNLCRCTGYRPILDAGERMFERRPALDDGPGGGRAAPAWPPTLALHGARRRSTPRARWPTSPRCARPPPRRGCWPAAPTSACGSTSSSATLPRAAVRLGAWPSCSASSEGRRQLHIGAAASLEAPGRRWPPLAGRAARAVAALRLAAGAPRRHDGRQRRQRLADRRLGAGADGAGRVARAAPRRSRELPLDDFYLGYMKNRCSRASSCGHRSAAAASGPGGARLQDQQTLRQRHLGAVRRPSRSTAHHVADARLAFGGMAATVRAPRRPRPRCAASPGDEATLQPRRPRWRRTSSP
jgi:xanthine dehydrogenase small subunit